jgi:FHS family L-fucose permease-like MFS transporter
MAFATMIAESRQDGSRPLIPRQSLTAFVLVTGLFFLWGIPNNLNDVLIRQFMTSFELTRFKAGLVQSAFYAGYFLLAMPAAMLMRRYGYKRGLLTGLVLYCIGTFLFLPAADSRQYWLFLCALFVIASGLSFLETGANPLVAQMGDAESAVRRLNFSQAFNPLGSIAGVLIGTVFIFSGVELTPAQIAQMKQAHTYDAYLRHETLRAAPPYIVLGLVVILWAAFILRTKFPAVAEAPAADTGGPQGSYAALLRYPHFLLAVAAQFCYIGAQVGTWSYFIQYVEDYTHLGEKMAGYLLTGTLAGFGAGRFVSSAWMKRVSPGALMGAFALVNIGLAAVGILFPGWVGMWAIFLTSFFMSPMFPTIFALGLRDLGENTKPAASLLVMAIIGGALFTPVIGLVFQAAHSMAAAMIVPLLCYVAVALYAFWGCELPARTCAAAGPHPDLD